jgi:hypothetical protein
VPWVIAPRGEFSKGALALKAWKKKPCIACCRAVGLHAGVIWQASSDLEAEDIRRVMGAGALVRVAADLTEQVGPLPGVPPEHAGPMRVCFLSRLSPKKNLLYAIDVICRVRQPIRFDILGPLEDPAYWETCKRSIAQAPAGCTIEWKGEVLHEDVRRTLAGYDLMLFPTLGENFGHVIFEALAAGVPVLVSDQTPWQDLDARGSGWVRPLETPEAFVDVLESAAARDPAARRAAAVAAHAHALEHAEAAGEVHLAAGEQQGQRQAHRHESQEVDDERRPGRAAAAEAAGEHHQERQRRLGEGHDPHERRRQGRHVRLTADTSREPGCQRLGPTEKDKAHRRHQHGAGRRGQPDTPAGPRFVTGPEVLAGQRGRGHAERAARQKGE